MLWIHLGFINKGGYSKAELMSNRFKCLHSDTNKLLHILFEKLKLNKDNMPCWFQNRKRSVGQYLKLACDVAVQGQIIGSKDDMIKKTWNKWKKSIKQELDHVTTINPITRIPGAEGVMISLGWNRGLFCKNPRCLFMKTHPK